MSRIRRFDHVGITVADLDTVSAFFVGLGCRSDVTVRVTCVKQEIHTAAGVTRATARLNNAPSLRGRGNTVRS
jgi:hypothetical protein